MQSAQDEPVIDTKEWTVAAQKYTDVIARTTLHGTSRLVDQVHALEPFAASSYAVDLGCGTGSLTIKIHEKNHEARILATDIAEGMLKQVDRLQLANVSTRKEDGANLAGLEDDSFSHGVSSFVAVQSLYRVVKPGGIVGIATWGRRVDWADAVEIAGKRNKSDYNYVVPESPLAWRTESAHRTVLESVGLQDVQTETVSMPLAADGLKGAREYAFRGQNPVMKRMMADFVAQGGDLVELEGIYEKVLEERYPDGVGADAILGWGRKPL